MKPWMRSPCSIGTSWQHLASAIFARACLFVHLLYSNPAPKPFPSSYLDSWADQKQAWTWSLPWGMRRDSPKGLKLLVPNFLPHKAPMHVPSFPPLGGAFSLLLFMENQMLRTPSGHENPFPQILHALERESPWEGLSVHGRGMCEILAGTPPPLPWEAWKLPCCFWMARKLGRDGEKS